MPLSSDVNNRNELNESMREVTIDTRNTLGSIIKDELIINDDSNFIDVCTKDDGLFDSPNHIAEIEDIVINSDVKETMTNNSTINHVHNDKKVSEYSELCLSSGVTTQELINHTKQCKATKSFTCSACTFKCCSRHNFEHHMQKGHKISMKCAITSDSKEEMSKSMNNSSNERSAQNFSKIGRKKDIELYCAKCDNISKPTVLRQRKNTCGVCGTSVIYQCKICQKRYTSRESMYNHLKNYCTNIEPRFKCSQCDYKANQKGTLQRHVESKHTSKKCNYCSYKTMSKSQLNEHLRLKHKYKYSCSQCGKKYMNSKSFNDHHKNACELYFECNHCSYSTNVKSYLRRHIKSQHPL